MLAHLLVGATIASSYVAVIKAAVPKHVAALERNDPVVMRFRIRRILYLCGTLLLVVPAISVLLNSSEPTSTFWSVYLQMGLFPGFTTARSLRSDVIHIALAAAKIMVLYMGPICAYLLTESQHWRADLRVNFCTLGGVRDHIFAPVTEEFVYRAALLAVLAPRIQERQLILYSPLLFGLAHIHHGFSLYLSGQAPLLSAVISSAFQFTYTTLFGILANTFYVRSGYNLWCPIVVHGMCNLFGFPSFDLKDTHPRFFYVYCVLLVVGALSFLKLI